MPKSPPASPQEQQALSAYVKLWRASQAVETAAHRHLPEHQLTLSQFGVLEALYHLGPLHQRQLAEKILRSSGNLTMVIDNLERSGLVVRERDHQDRRAVKVKLTPAGRSLIGDIMPRHRAEIRALFSVLTSEEIEELSRLTRKLGRSASERLMMDASLRSPRRERKGPSE